VSRIFHPLLFFSLSSDLRLAATKALGNTGEPPVIVCARTLREAEHIFTSRSMEGLPCDQAKQLLKLSNQLQTTQAQLEMLQDRLAHAEAARLAAEHRADRSELWEMLQQDRRRQNFVLDLQLCSHRYQDGDLVGITRNSSHSSPDDGN
jgi:uncharacterized protein with von Willebrand factor type A (vWA) domain